MRIGQHDHVRIRHPVGRRDDDLITRVKHRHAQVKQRLLGTGGDQHLIARIADAVIALELGDDRIFQVRRAIGVGIARVTGAYGGDAGLTDVGGRIEVRLTD